MYAEDLLLDARMDEKLKPADMNEQEDGRSGGKLKFHHPRLPGSDWSAKVDSITGSLTDIQSSSEQVSTEETELSSADVSGNVFSQKTRKTTPTEYDVHDSSRGSTSGGSNCRPGSVERNEPKPLRAPLPASTETRTPPDGSRSFTSIRSQGSKTTVAHSEADGGDLCAAILLACLFCHPLDCVLATWRGCNTCVGSLCSSLCSSLCGCEPTTLQPLLDAVGSGDMCECLGVRCLLCDCPLCDICLQATECLDLAMEISQMLYH